MTPSDAVALLDRRAALLDGSGADGAELERVTHELREALRAGDPRVRRITAGEPDDLLERLRAAEPVHPIASDADLADRLDEDRRCFVLEHPLLPGRPYNVVWVALWQGVASSIQDVLEQSAPTGDPAAADTAVFYSIWGVERGLRGFPGGAHLITGAVEALRRELPGLSTFVTLSPLPGFREWWERRHPDDATFPDDEELLSECAAYLTTLEEGRPIDPVAHFHLGNGARLHALQRHGDRSARGARRSFGIMANYRYEPEDREANAAALREGRVAVGDDVQRLLNREGEPNSR